MKFEHLRLLYSVLTILYYILSVKCLDLEMFNINNSICTLKFCSQFT